MSFHPRTPPWAALWFPFFFAVAFPLTMLLSFAAPQPHDLDIRVEPDEGVSAPEVAAALDGHQPGGFDVTIAHDSAGARDSVRTNEAAGAYVLNAEGTATLVVASAGSPTRAAYLDRLFTHEIGPGLGVRKTVVEDVVPKSPGDMSGVGLFFFGLPLLLVGMITSIVLLQLASWHTWRKVGALASTGLFATLFSFGLAWSVGVIPRDPWLLGLGFTLTQTVGWLTTAFSMLAKRHFMPLSMTFVLVLGIPTSGGTVSADMLPSLMGTLHDLLPFGQFVDATRSVAYFDRHGALRHVLIMAGWLVAAGILLVWAHRRHRTPHPDAPPTEIPATSRHT